MKERITRRIKQAIADKTFPGCVVEMVTRDGKRTILPYGNFTYEDDSPEVRDDTLWDLASITKSIPTASIALQLLEQEKIRLDDLVTTYVPEFRNAQRKKLRIKHLLTYTAGNYGMVRSLKQSLPSLGAKDLKELLLTKDFEEAPGTSFSYSNVSAALLTLVIENAADKPLDVLGHERFFTPLEMQRTTFAPKQFPLQEIAPTEIDEWRGLVQGVVHDESAYIFKTKAHETMGYAGLFSTAPDLLNFLEMLLNNGTLNGKQYFAPTTIEKMHTNQISELQDYTGLGWELYQPRYMGKRAAPHTFGKTGFTGTLVLCDIEKGIAFTLLSNRTYPTRPKDSTAINRVRHDIADIIWEHA